MHFKLLLAFVDDQVTNKVMDAAREAGATGATVISNARGEGIEKVHIQQEYQVEEVSRRQGARAFSFKSRVFGNHQNLDSATTKGPGLPDHELNRIIQQAQSQKLPQRHLANRDSNSVPARLARAHSDAGMVLPAPAENTTPIVNTRMRVTQAQASVQLAAGGPTEKRTEPTHRIDAKEVADRVYRLMQRDLIIEGERSAELGG